MGTHRDKVGASKVPNDSCGRADAHVANDGEKPPARRKDGEGAELRESCSRLDRWQGHSIQCENMRLQLCVMGAKGWLEGLGKHRRGASASEQ